MPTAIEELIGAALQAIEGEHFGLFAIGMFAVMVALALLRWA